MSSRYSFSFGYTGLKGCNEYKGVVPNMPRKTDHLAINNPTHDKRVKLTEENKAAIKSEYETGLFSINGLARKWKVSKRLIQFTLFPERAEHAKKLYAQRRKDGRYYDKDKHTESVRLHRIHKKELFENGLLGVKQEKVQDKEEPYKEK